MKKLDIIAVQSLPLALLICVTTPLLAAEGESSNVISLEEITVTAQRRSENLQSVPIAITALTAADITRQGVHDLGSLATQVPGLTFAPFAPSQNIISLRGVSSNDDGPGTDNSVAVFVDDVYMGRVSNINPTMFDVDRVEVLRGPQGTLYGKNTIGGAISVVTSRPDTDSLNVKVSADYGNFNRHDFSALVTGPISSGWAGKLAVVTRDADGSVNNVVLHTKEKNDDDRAVRGQLLRTGDSSTLLLSADFERLHDEDMARIPLGPVTTNLPVNFVAEYQALCGNNYLTCATNPGDGFAYRDSGGVSAKYTDHVTSSSDFISITAVRRNYDSSSMDSLGAPWAGLGALMNYVDDATNQYSEELRWVSSFNRLQYVAGLWAMREDTDRLRVFILPSLSPLFADNDSYRGINRTLSYAGFGQADWHFADQWTLTFGGRYSYDHKHIDNNSVHGPDGVLGIIPVTFSNEREASWSKFTPKISISYQPTTALNLYATAVEGFKSGGFAASPVSIADTNPLLPEQAINIEGGAKLEISSRFRANLAIFDTNYKNLQIQSFGPPANCVPGPGVSCAGQFETFNAPGAYAKGAELEVSWLPINGLTLNASFGYLDARFKGVVLPNADFPNQSGQDMIRSPRQKENVEAIYQWSGFGGQFAASGDYSFTASQRGELEPYAVQPKYDLINGRLSWSSPQHWDIALWGKNLADKAWVSHVYTIGGEVFGVFGDPRTYGVTVNWHLK